MKLINDLSNYATTELKLQDSSPEEYKKKKRMIEYENRKGHNECEKSHNPVTDRVSIRSQMMST